MNNQPLVSVIMPCFNAALFIEDSIRSVYSQSYTNWELIIINDGSTDYSLEVIGKFDDKRIRLINLPRNFGIKYCRDLGIQEAKGKYLCWLDADDIALSNRLSIQVQAFETNPTLVLCSSAVNLLHNGEEIAPVKYLEVASESLKARLFFTFPFTNSSIALRTATIKSLQDLPQSYKQAEDYILYCRIVQSGHFLLINKPLVLYRIHKSESRITSDRNNADIVHGRMIAWRIILEYLQLQTSDEVLEVHDKITYYRNRITKANTIHFSGYIQLLANMKNANRNLGVFEKKSFESGIVNRMYSTLLHNTLTMKDAIALGWKFRDSLGYTTLMKLTANRLRRLVLQIDD